MTAHLEVKGISKQFSGKHGSVLALDDINLHVEAGEFVLLPKRRVERFAGGACSRLVDVGNHHLPAAGSNRMNLVGK